MRCFVVRGLTNGGLFLARQLKRQWPLCHIYGVGNPRKDVGRYSNVLTSFYSVSSAKDTYSILERICQMHEGIEAFICSNVMLEWLTSGPEQLVTRLRFQNDFDIYRLFADKKLTTNYLKDLKINVPADYCLSDGKFDQIEYPIIIKPAEKMATIGLSKCTFIDSPQALCSFLKRVESLGISQDSLVPQQYISGDNRWEYGYGGYFIDGHPLVDICFHQFRQIPQGLCCYIREISDEHLSAKIKETISPVLESTRYNGFIEFDIKQDANSKKLYVLDVNPRPWRSSDMLTVKLGSSTVFEPNILDKKVIWRQPYLEFKSRKNKSNVPYYDCKRLSKSNNYQTYVTLFDFRDLKPLLKNMLLNINDAVHYIRRCF